MAALLERSDQFFDGWRHIRNILDSYGPPSLALFREESIRRYEAVGFPSNKDEEYKYTPLREIAEASFSPAYGAIVSRAQYRQTALGKLNGPTLVFINGQYAPELSDVQGLPEGAMVAPLPDALDNHQELVMAHLGKIATLEGRLGSTNDERFVWLNNAHIGEGAFVYLPPRSTCTEPITLAFLSEAEHGPFVAHPRVLIVAEEDARASVVESYIGLSGTYFNNCVCELHLGRGAHVEHTRYQQESSTAFHISTVHAHQEAQSTWTSTSVQFGGKIARNDVNAFVDGEHAETWLNGVYMGDHEQLLDNHTRIDHAKPHCNSFEVYKGILNDRATGVFNGKIFVYLDAQKTDAKQTNQALLLSKEASINTKPQLEIFADDVKCTHGATVGQLREDALFYLRARGIPKEEARAMLVYAFAAEVLEKLSSAPVKQALEKALFNKLNRK